MRVALAVLLTLSGCAEISGLDGLDVCDGACADVTTSDAQQSSEAGADASDGGVADAIAKDVAMDAVVIDVVNDVTSQPCTKPADCVVGDVCCETLVTKGNFFPSCVADADTVACAQASACPSTQPFTCGTFLLRRCTANADCTETAEPKCCTLKFGDGGATREICMNAQNAQLAGATCL